MTIVRRTFARQRRVDASDGHTYFSHPATPEQRETIRQLGGHPPDWLTRGQAATAIQVLRSKQRGYPRTP